MDLILTNITGYEVWESDGRTRSLKGYCKDYDLAVIESKKDGWGSDTTKVKEVELFTDGAEIYVVDKIKGDQFLDSLKSREEILTEIKNKLNPEELNILRKHLLEQVSHTEQ